MLEICPNCGASHPPNGACVALDGATVISAEPRPQPSLNVPTNGGASGENRGRVLQGRYEILHVLGQGGMGTVFMARDLRLKGRSCVVKKLRDDFYREEDRQKAEAFFEREMQVLSDLQHRNIVQILDFFCEGYDYYLVMEYVQGNNLHYMLHEERQGEPFTENTVIDWAIQVCDVLSYLHSQTPPVIYRDLKPSNIMIDVKGEVKLVDFGIARPYEEKGEHTHVVSAGYSPPEQYWGQADPRSDIYSLGATMHFLLSGRDPDALHVCSPQSINPEVSDYTDQLVRKATSQELTERFQSIEEFMEALLHKDYVPAPETPKSKIGEIVTGVILLLVAVFIFIIETMSVNDPNAGKSTNAHDLPGEPDVVDAKQYKAPAPVPSLNPQPSNGTNATDLAVQVMDEKDLTDPAGAPEQKPQPFGFSLPWIKSEQK